MIPGGMLFIPCHHHLSPSPALQPLITTSGGDSGGAAGHAGEGDGSRRLCS